MMQPYYPRLLNSGDTDAKDITNQGDDDELGILKLVAYYIFILKLVVAMIC